LQKLAAFASFFDYLRAFCIATFAKFTLSMLHVKYSFFIPLQLLKTASFPLALPLLPIEKK